MIITNIVRYCLLEVIWIRNWEFLSINLTSVLQLPISWKFYSGNNSFNSINIPIFSIVAISVIINIVTNNMINTVSSTLEFNRKISPQISLLRILLRNTPSKARNSKDVNWLQTPIILHPIWKMKRKPISRKLSIRKTIFNARNALKNLTRITRYSPIFVLLIHLRHYNARPNKEESKFYWYCSAFLNHASSC
jgi:hypothetical protein